MNANALATYPKGDHTDPAVKGLQLRVRNSSRTWLFRYRWRDESVRVVLGHLQTMGLADARSHALALRKAIDDGIDPRRARPRRRARAALVPQLSAPADPGNAHTVDSLVAEFVARKLRAPREQGGRKRPQDAEAMLARDVLPEWTGRDARTITAREVVELLDGIVDRGSPKQANRTHSLLGQLFAFGVRRAIVAATPVLPGRPGGKEKPRERTLTEAELTAYLADPRACLPERLAHAATLLLLTGQRRGELALSRWRDVDLDARTWAIPDENAKGGRGHVVPLSDWAAAEFRALKRLAGRSAWVLPSRTGEKAINPQSLSVIFLRCAPRFKKAGIAEFVLHDLRRTARTLLAQLGVEPHVAERVLNHAQDKIAGTYDRHAYLDEKRAALDKWAAHLKALKT